MGIPQRRIMRRMRHTVTGLGEPDAELPGGGAQVLVVLGITTEIFGSTGTRSRGVRLAPDRPLSIIGAESMTKRRKFWGWGYEEDAIDDAHAAAIADLLAARFGCERPHLAPGPRLEEVSLPTPKVAPPPALAAMCSVDPYDRAGHTYGKAFRDVVRGFGRDFAPAPDFVAFPRSEANIVALLDWASSKRVAAIPYGGGSSVCGGVEARLPNGYQGAISIDLARLDRVVEIDRTSRAGLSKVHFLPAGRHSVGEA